MGWIVEAVIDWILIGILDRVSRKARLWVVAVLLVVALALLIALIWILIPSR